MNTPLLSICIPTFNRAKLLKESLSSIVKQLTTKNLLLNVEIVISDNNSQDDTEKVVGQFKRKFRQIKYFKNNKNIGIINTIKVAEYTKGEYIWFFSDDDWHKQGSIKKIVAVIKENSPDLLLVNLDLYSKDGKTALDPNLLRANGDNFVGRKREFFRYLESKFFLPIDWYMTSYSNTVVKAELFKTEVKKAYSFYNKGCLFPHTTFFYYSANDYKVAVISQSQLKFRADNRSFGSQEKNKFLIDWYKTLRQHYDRISLFNKKYLSNKFIFLLFVKQSLRSLRLGFLLIFGVDISDFLMKYFYKKS